ncbi:MAG: DUF58 domain-containing protein [Chloroflexi bacterium]|nr:DUF58 domain-containing protein [Chloroflexota bacterium]
MDRLSWRNLARIYALLLLLAAAMMAAPPHSFAALALLLVVLYTWVRPAAARLNVVFSVAAVFLAPLVSMPLFRYASDAGPALQIMGSVTALPLLYLLDCSLRERARQAKFMAVKKDGRYISPDGKALFTAIFVMVLVSLSLGEVTLLATTAVLGLYLGIALAQAALAIPRLSLGVDTVWKRIVAGSVLNLSLPVSKRGTAPMLVRIDPGQLWNQVRPEQFVLDGDSVELALTIVPLLAGPARPNLRASVLGPRGLVQVDQTLEPVDLHVIPRAKYARWLAMKYLGHTGAGSSATALSLLHATSSPRRGIEYYESRHYQPGDQQRNIDWKHTMKLLRLIVKQFIQAGEQTAVIAVNLAVSDAEEADKLAFNLITASLTLAEENIPTALVAYNHREVKLSIPLSPPTEVLEQTLSLVKDIVLAPCDQRYLEAPDIHRLRLNMARLRKASSGPAQRLYNLLDFEYRALEKAARNHPATTALSLATERIQPPALIVMISQFNHDAEALLVIGERLNRRHFTSIRLESPR